MNWYFEALRKYAEFNGRARRKEFWFFFLINTLISWGLFAVDYLAHIFVLNPIYGLVMLLPGLGVTVRRLHDTDRSGWWILISLVPVIGGIVLIVLLAQEGGRGSNRFGTNPKAVELSPVIDIWASDAKGETGAFIEAQVRRQQDSDVTRHSKERSWTLSGFDSDGRTVHFKIAESDLRHASDGIVLGRSRGVAHLVIGDDTVSRSHARLLLKDGQLYIEDLGSANGTAVDGRWINDASTLTLVRDNAQLTIGEIELSVNRAKG